MFKLKFCLNFDVDQTKEIYLLNRLPLTTDFKMLYDCLLRLKFQRISFDRLSFDFK